MRVFDHRLGIDGTSFHQLRQIHKARDFITSRFLLRRRTSFDIGFQLIVIEQQLLATRTKRYINERHEGTGYNAVSASVQKLGKVILHEK